MKTKEEIAQVLRTIQESDAIANAEMPSTALFSEVAAYQGMKMNAAQASADNKIKYGAFVESHLGAIILKGDRAKQVAFAEISKKIGDTIVFDTNAFYEKLTQNSFYMTGGAGSLGVDQIATIFTELRLKSRNDLGMTRMREPDFHWMFMHAWNSNEALAEGIRKSVFLTNGISLTHKAMMTDAVSEALAKPNARTTVPLVIIGMKKAEEAEFMACFTHGYIVVDVDAVEPTEENVTKTFIELRDIIRNPANTKETTNG
jgi:hypothetical protein